jgi:hypothetical protein
MILRFEEYMRRLAEACGSIFDGLLALRAPLRVCVPISSWSANSANRWQSNWLRVRSPRIRQAQDRCPRSVVLSRWGTAGDALQRQDGQASKGAKRPAAAASLDVEPAFDATGALATDAARQAGASEIQASSSVRAATFRKTAGGQRRCRCGDGRCRGSGASRNLATWQQETQ